MLPKAQFTQDAKADLRELLLDHLIVLVSCVNTQKSKNILFVCVVPFAGTCASCVNGSFALSLVERVWWD